MGRFVSALKLCATFNWVAGVTVVLDEEPPTGVVAEPAALEDVVPALGDDPLLEVVLDPDEEPLEGVVPAVGEATVLEVVPEPDEEPLVEVAAEPDEEPLVEVVAALDGDPLVEGAPAVGGDAESGVVTAADAMPTPWAAPVALALLPLHAGSTSNTALLVSTATQFPSDKFRFISVILRSLGGRIMLTEANRTQLSPRGDCRRSATIFVAE